MEAGTSFGSGPEEARISDKFLIGIYGGPRNGDNSKAGKALRSIIGEESSPNALKKWIIINV